MITIEPAPTKTFRAGTLRKRELAQFVACAAAALGLAGEISVLLAGDERIRELNSRFRGKNKSTDVLSFPAALHFPGSGQAGDLAISIETAARQAEECGHTLETEVKVLLLHGLLHLAGYDHEADSGEMARRESRLRKKLALPLGLIERGAKPHTGVRPPPRRNAAEVTPRNPRSRQR
jgi:probable rRNA maturation factor